MFELIVPAFSITYVIHGVDAVGLAWFFFFNQSEIDLFAANPSVNIFHTLKH